MTKAYSYIRFSTPAQLKGDSLRRQLAKSEKFAAKHDLKLDTSLRDMGVSAYKGVHRHKGALASFLSKIEFGEIDRGSYLIVENLDRLSREQVLEALTLFLSIINAGVVVATLNDGMVYSRQSIADRPNDLLISIGGLIKGNRESADKGDRLQEVWQNKRDELGSRRKFTRQGPGWLDLVADDPADPLVGDWLFNDRAAVVRRILEMCVNGLGKSAIAERLNVEGVSSFKHGDGWGPSTVALLLTDRRAIGEFQPMTKVDGPRRPVGDPIKGYFATAGGETVVSEETFYLAQAEIARRWSGAKLGKVKRVPNLFVGRVARCQCGRTMEFRDKRSRSYQPDKAVFHICSGAQRGRQCSNKARFTYPDTERLILDWITDIELRDDNRAGVTAIKVSAKQAERDDTKRRLDSAFAQWENESDDALKARLYRRVQQYNAALPVIEAELANLERLLSETKRSVIDQRRAEVRTLREKLVGLSGDALFEMRARLAAALRQTIDHIEFRPDGSFTATLRGGLKLYHFDHRGFAGAFDLSAVNPDGADDLLTFPSGETIAAMKLSPMTVSGIRETLAGIAEPA